MLLAVEVLRVNVGLMVSSALTFANVMRIVTTLTVKVDGIVNQRLITHVGDHDDELPLTAAVLLGIIWSNDASP